MWSLTPLTFPIPRVSRNSSIKVFGLNLQYSQVQINIYHHKMPIKSKRKINVFLFSHSFFWLCWWWLESDGWRQTEKEFQNLISQENCSFFSEKKYCAENIHYHHLCRPKLLRLRRLYIMYASGVWVKPGLGPESRRKPESGIMPGKVSHVKTRRTKSVNNSSVFLCLWIE